MYFFGPRHHIYSRRIHYGLKSLLCCISALVGSGESVNKCRTTSVFRFCFSVIRAFCCGKFTFATFQQSVRNVSPKFARNETKKHPKIKRSRYNIWKFLQVMFAAFRWRKDLLSMPTRSKIEGGWIHSTEQIVGKGWSTLDIGIDELALGNLESIQWKDYIINSVNFKMKSYIHKHHNYEGMNYWPHCRLFHFDDLEIFCWNLRKFYFRFTVINCLWYFRFYLAVKITSKLNIPVWLVSLHSETAKHFVKILHLQLARSGFNPLS